MVAPIVAAGLQAGRSGQAAQQAPDGEPEVHDVAAGHEEKKRSEGVDEARRAAEAAGWPR